MKKLGIVGGLGPMASAYFYELLTAFTDAQSDQEHLELVLFSRTQVPDRTAYILGKSAQSPAPVIIDSINALSRLGSELIAIPCVTAHYFYDEIAGAVNLPVINIVRETAARVHSLNIKTVGLMGTTGTAKGSLFQNELSKFGIKSIMPDSTHQEALNSIIYGIKSGHPIDFELFMSISDALMKSGAEENILGCTELALISKYFTLGGGFINTLSVLALEALRRCGAKIREVNNAD